MFPLKHSQKEARALQTPLVFQQLLPSWGLHMGFVFNLLIYLHAHVYRCTCVPGAHTCACFHGGLSRSWVSSSSPFIWFFVFVLKVYGRTSATTFTRRSEDSFQGSVFSVHLVESRPLSFLLYCAVYFRRAGQKSSQQFFCSDHKSGGMTGGVTTLGSF